MSKVFEKAVAELDLDRSDWQLVKFGDVAIQQKQSVNRENTELTRYVKGEHMYSEDIHLREWGELKDEYLGPAFIRKFEEGDILYGSRRTYLRKVVVAPFEGITSNTTFVVKANEEKIDKRLLPFIMLSEGFSQHSIKNSKGSVNPYVNWKDLAGYEFLLPNKTKQEEICDLLEIKECSIQAKINLKQKLILSQNSSLKSYFDRDVEFKQIRKVGEIITGSTPSTKDKNLWGGDIPFVTAPDFVDGKSYVIETERTLTVEGMNKSRNIPVNSLMVVCIASVGKIAISSAECVTNQQINTVIPNSEMDVKYLFHTLSIFNHLITSKAANSVVPIINKGDFGLIKIPILEKGLRGNFVKEADKFESARSALDDSIVKCKILQKSLINKVF